LQFFAIRRSHIQHQLGIVNSIGFFGIPVCIRDRNTGLGILSPKWMDISMWRRAGAPNQQRASGTSSVRSIPLGCRNERRSRLMRAIVSVSCAGPTQDPFPCLHDFIASQIVGASEETHEHTHAQGLEMLKI
jgi:hypothetical protein